MVTAEPNYAVVDPSAQVVLYSVKQVSKGDSAALPIKGDLFFFTHYAAYERAPGGALDEHSQPTPAGPQGRGIGVEVAAFWTPTPEKRPAGKRRVTRAKRSRRPRRFWPDPRPHTCTTRRIRRSSSSRGRRPRAQKMRVPSPWVRLAGCWFVSWRASWQMLATSWPISRPREPPRPSQLPTTAQAERACASAGCRTPSAADTRRPACSRTADASGQTAGVVVRRIRMGNRRGAPLPATVALAAG